jgi:hypothetical protein
VIANNNGDRPLPYSEDAEKGVLCSLILAPKEAGEMCQRLLQAEYFYAPAHRITYGVLLEWRGAGQVEFPWLVAEIKKLRALNEVGGKEFLNELMTFVPTGSNAGYYIEGVCDAWQRRSAILEYRRRELAAFDQSTPASSFDPDRIFASNGNLLKGASFLDFSLRKIDHTQTLLGNRYLCRGGGLFIVAPSGHGKSVLVAQAAILWACDQRAFGIKPTKPLRILIVQAEDDDGDIIEMAQIINHLELSESDRALVRANTHVEFVNYGTGDSFLDIVDGFLSQWKPDILIINPYTAYLGADIKDDAANNHFLRNRLNPILTKYGCAVIIVHHTPKTNFRDTTAWKPSDWMYSGAGAACLTNWARAYLVIDPCEESGVYKFIAAKRGKRIGWADASPVYEQFWAWSREDGQLLWLPANQEQAAAAKPRGQKGPKDLLPLVPLVDPCSIDRIFLAAKPMGENTVRSFLKILIEDGEVDVHETPRKNARPSLSYVRHA